MNPTSGNTGTSSTGSSNGSGKVSNAVRYGRGVAEVIHGVGENIRGTTLGAVDQLSKDTNLKNEEIAEKGRLETQRGLADIRSGQSSRGQTSHVGTQSPYADPYARSAYSTTTGVPGENQGGFQERNVATGYGSGPDVGHPETTRSGYTTGQTKSSNSTGTQYPGGGASTDLYGTTGSESATQEKQPYTRRFGNPNEQGSTGTAVPEPTTYPGPGHHREDAVGTIPNKQMHEVQQGAYGDDYNQNSAYGNEFDKSSSGATRN
ncbi:hypothetical protein BDN70DRAFT_990718 [Pholiota conissans]|uniref:Uncharacterized protein n=1 Tax=Pholiota conissans TaxID=109636 RepID=A0A9P6D3Y2_9AGAR|nr:hypothetical protein BDN70DRAFT_990718 [Pholiota conissans]